MAHHRSVAALAEKIAYLSRPESYGEGANAVEIVETHMSYVFLVDRLVFKLKKPVRYPFLDFSTLEARRFDCDEELRLNRRLARNVYLDVVPLALSARGLQLEGPGHPVDWLVKMRRLPRHLMLDRAIQENRVTESDVLRFMRVLAAFYCDAERIALAAPAYRERLSSAIEQNREALSPARYGIAPVLLDRIAGAALCFIRDHADVLDERIERNAIVEGHGDLRPEHVCLAAEPVFIDCLEFNRDLRTVDPADELAYLAMECEFAGAGEIRQTIFASYRDATGDDMSESLVDFYQVGRALLRAKLSALHIEDHLTENDRVKWLKRAHDYVELAQQCCARLG